MAIVIARLSGIVTYTDGGKGQFAAMLDKNGNVSYNGGPNNYNSAENLAEVYATVPKDQSPWHGIPQSSWFIHMFSQLSGITWQPIAGQGDLPADWVTTESVGSAVCDFMGRVTLDDDELAPGFPSWQDFHITWWIYPPPNDGGVAAFVAHNPLYADAISSGALAESAWHMLRLDPVLVAALNTMLTPLGLTVSVYV